MKYSLTRDNEMNWIETFILRPLLPIDVLVGGSFGGSVVGTSCQLLRYSHWLFSSYCVSSYVLWLYIRCLSEQLVCCSGHLPVTALPRPLDSTNPFSQLISSSLLLNLNVLNGAVVLVADCNPKGAGFDYPLRKIELRTMVWQINLGKESNLSSNPEKEIPNSTRLLR
jgi:hypothetical protein